MMHARLRLDLKCPKHPRYSPVDGEGAIKAGCVACWELHDLFVRIESIKLVAAAYREVYPQRALNDAG
jgi:hypothetical protein